MTAQPPSTFGKQPEQPWRFDAAELADLHAVGGLSEAEQAELAARIAASDPEIAAELRRVAPLIESLAAEFAAEEAPPADIRAEVLSRIDAARQDDTGEEALVQEMFADAREAAAERTRAGTRKQPVSVGSGGDSIPAEVIVRRAAEGRWWPTGLPGVWGKPLYKSRRADRETLLVKCDPGALIPRHAHEGIEELIVLEGTLRVGDVLLGPGDYIRSTPGADHGDAISPDGCVCLFFTSHGVMSPRSQVIMFFRGIANWLKSLFGGGR
jgi:anti-sigma factor ChrR (cupin superfamily)